MSFKMLLQVRSNITQDQLKIRLKVTVKVLIFLPSNQSNIQVDTLIKPGSMAEIINKLSI